MVKVNPVRAVGATVTVNWNVPRLVTLIWSVAELVAPETMGMHKGCVTVVSLKSPTLSVKLVTDPR